MEQAEENAKEERCFMYPEHTPRRYWDLWLLFLILYVTFFIPLRIGFQVAIEPGEFWWWIDLITDLSFFVDILLNFVSADRKR